VRDGLLSGMQLADSVAQVVDYADYFALAQAVLALQTPGFNQIAEVAAWTPLEQKKTDFLPWGVVLSDLAVH